MNIFSHSYFAGNDMKVYIFPYRLSILTVSLDCTSFKQMKICTRDYFKKICTENIEYNALLNPAALVKLETK